MSKGTCVLQVQTGPSTTGHCVLGFGHSLQVIRPSPNFLSEVFKCLRTYPLSTKKESRQTLIFFFK